MVAQEPHIVVIGSGPVAYLTALQLHADGHFTTLVTTAPSSPPPLCPELAALWGEDNLPGLFHQSLGLWRSAPQRLSLPSLLGQADFYDLATTPGRQAKYQEESMLDALGGESIMFIPTLPPAFSPMPGAKHWSEAPHIAAGLMLTLADAVAARQIPTHTAHPQSLTLDGAVGLTLADGTLLVATHIVFASAEAARNLLAATPYSIPLRPARGHKLTFQTPAEPLIPAFLHRMKKGHLFAFPQTPTQLDVYYDGLLDPLQATASTQPNTQLAAALAQHLGTLVPSLAGRAPTQTETFTSWLTPDFLPVLGIHPLQPALIFATGWSGREAAAAPLVAQQISESFTAETVPFNPAFLPNRFITGVWQKVAAPGSLVWQEPTSEKAPPSLMSTPPEYMSNVQMVETSTAQYAGTVRQTEKVITSAEKKPAEVRVRNAKPKIQMASVKPKE